MSHGESTDTSADSAPPEAGKRRWYRLLRNPWMSLLGVAIGILIGYYLPAVTRFLGPIGRIYLAMLQMCVLPIITTAVMMSIGRLLRSGQANQYVGRLVLVFAVGVFMTASLGATMALVGQPGSNLTSESRKALGQIFLQAEESPGTTSETQEATGFWSLLDSLVPDNIFSAFSTGESLAVVFFSILFGAAMGTHDTCASLLPGVEAIYRAFLNILNWALVALPIGLCCLLSDQIATMGFDIIYMLARLVALFYGGCVLLYIVYTLSLCLASRRSLVEVLSGLKEATMISFVVQSSVPAIPIALTNMEKRLGLSGTVSSFTVPLGVIINRQGYAMLFALTAVFVAQLYEHHLGADQILLVIAGSALAGMAAVGAPAVIAPMLAYVLGPLGLPVSVGIAIFIAISPAVDPILSMTNLYASCASAGLVGKDSFSDSNIETAST